MQTTSAAATTSWSGTTVCRQGRTPIFASAAPMVSSRRTTTGPIIVSMPSASSDSRTKIRMNFCDAARTHTDTGTQHQLAASSGQLPTSARAKARPWCGEPSSPPPRGAVAPARALERRAPVALRTVHLAEQDSRATGLHRHDTTREGVTDTYTVRRCTRQHRQICSCEGVDSSGGEGVTLDSNESEAKRDCK